MPVKEPITQAEPHEPEEPEEPATFHQRARRDQLLDLAIALIAESGLAAASTSEIARRAGVSRGVVNYNVGGREALMDLVVERVYRLGYDSVRPAVDAAAGPAAALRAFVVASIDFYAERPDALRALREVFSAPDLVDRAAARGYRDEVRGLTDLVVEAQQRGEVDDGDAGLVVALLRAALDHAALRIADGADRATQRAQTLRVLDRVLGPGPAGGDADPVRS